MKLQALLAPVLFVSAIVTGCADTSDGDSAASESNVNAVSATTHVDGIAACNGKKICAETFVLKTLLSSKLELTEMFQGKEPMSLASEHFVSWMQAGNETYSTYGITTKPLGNGKYTVSISLGNKDLGEGGTESGCGFSFTIDHDVIVESKVAASCAG